MPKLHLPVLLIALASCAALAQTPAAPTTAPTAAPTTAAANAAQAAAARVIVGHPVVAGLAQQITKGTPIELWRAAPARLPASRQPSYLAGGKGLDELLAAATQAQAVLSLRSVWPDDQLYPLARRANLRIVEIDVANPIEGDLPGIALSEAAKTGQGSASVLTRQPWQDTANLARMAMTLADTLSRLLPAQQSALQANLLAVTQRLQQAQAEASRLLAQADDVSVLVLSPRVQTLATALQLEPVPWQAPAKDAEVPAALAQAMRTHKPRAILAHAAPDEDVQKAIDAAGVPVIVLAENAPDPVQALTSAMQAIAQAISKPH